MKMRFRGNYTLTFHAGGGVSKVDLPEPPPGSPLASDDFLVLPDEDLVAIVKKAICNRALHHSHTDAHAVPGEGVRIIHCETWVRNHEMIQFILEMRLDLLLHPDLFPLSAPGTERHGW